MANLVFSVQSVSTAGPDRASVNLNQVDPNAGVAPAPGAAPLAGQAFFGSNLSLNLTTDEASDYKVNSRYTLSLTPEAAAAPAPAAKTPPA